MLLPNDIRCRCGETVVLSVTSGMWSCRCSQCGRSAGPEDSSMSLYAEWYNLIPVRKAGEEIGKTMTAIIMKLSERGCHVDAKELLSLADDEAVGRRSIEILKDTGLMSARYVCDGEEVSFEDAVELKSNGKKLEVSFVKTFSRKT